MYLVVPWSTFLVNLLQNGKTGINLSKGILKNRNTVISIKTD